MNQTVPMRFLTVLLLLWMIVPLAWADEAQDFMAARAAFAEGNLEALETLAVRLQHSPLEPYVTYYRLRLRWDDADDTPIRNFFARKNDTPVIDQFRREWLKYMASLGRWEAFEAEYPNLVETDAELTCYALQRQRLQEEDKALKGVRAVWLSNAAWAENCLPLFEAAIQRGLITQDAVQQRMQRLLTTGKITWAKKLNDILPEPMRWPTAELDAAWRDPQEYLQTASFVAAPPGRRHIALFALQRLARRSVDLADSAWQRIMGYFPEAERRQGFAVLGHAAALAHDERALGWFDAAGDAELSENQRAWRVRAALRAENWRAVNLAIDAMPATQQSLSAWRYWKARALKALGYTAKADAIFAELARTFGYYGQLALEELGDVTATRIPTKRFIPSDNELAAMQARPEIQRSLLLYRLGLYVEAAKEWDWALRGMNDRELLTAAEVAKRHQMYDRSIDAAVRTVELHDFYLRYPAPYREILQSYLREYQVEEAWVYGLIRQESRFAIHAKSKAGAAGLMQIMPGTAHWVARRLGLKGFRKGMIHQLDLNLRFGTYYMKTVQSRFDDNPVLASAAYNAGPSRAQKWRANRPLEGAIYIETIPFDETRNYVRKVMSNTVYYAKLFGHGNKTLKQRLGVIEGKAPAVTSDVR